MARLADVITAVHQIELLAGARRYGGNKISVSCTCLRRTGHRGSSRGIIETRARFPAPDALAAWRAWHEEEGVPL